MALAAVGVSLSMEVGDERPLFSPDTWTWEIRPIIDKKTGRWYFAVNPALEIGHGTARTANFKESAFRRRPRLLRLH